MPTTRDKDDDDAAGTAERLRNLGRGALEAARDIAHAIEDRTESAVDALLHATDRDEWEERDDDHGRGTVLAGRPGRVVGINRGELDGTPITKGDLRQDHPAGSWAGPRKDSYLPMIFLRAYPGDNGSRPVIGPFWESPDIYVLAGVSPKDAPDVPTALGQSADAGVENTLYAHVWNLGNAPAEGIVVEFYWLDPSLGVDAGGVHLIGQTVTSLGARSSGNAHRVVKCPEPWIATYANGGHECLLVRAWTLIDDQLGQPAWDASNNRHLGQRNIHVVSAADAPAMAPVQLRVGPLFGGQAVVQVERAVPTAMPWLQLHTGTRGQFPAAALATGQAILTAPAPIGTAMTAAAGERHDVTSDGQQTTFSTTDAAPGAGQAHVYRVTASQGGQVFGGYTIVISG
ncbi:MAG: hypothetical protein M3N95_16340 [Actinomycetota bacterium]|nr:hypothetical protein [Actinomycetota bacterium]